jgi:hypothetical protein
MSTFDNAIANRLESNRLWRVVFRVGLAAILSAFAISFVASLGYFVDSLEWALGEGRQSVELVVGTCAVVCVAAGFLLLIPNILHLIRDDSPDSADRVLWLIFLLFFFFIASYVYFRRWHRNGGPEPGIERIRRGHGVDQQKNSSRI